MLANISDSNPRSSKSGISWKILSYYLGFSKTTAPSPMPYVSCMYPRTIPSFVTLSLCSSSGGLGGGHTDGILLGKLPSM